MKNFNRNGIPLWLIKRLLITRINKSRTHTTFDIAKNSDIFVDGKCESHIDLVYYNKKINDFFIPIAI